MKRIWKETLRRVKIDWRSKVKTWRRHKIERRRITEEIGGWDEKSSFKRGIESIVIAT